MVRAIRSGLFAGGLLRRFRRAEGGLALVEFALVLPVMVLLYVGGVAVTQGIMTERKVIVVARSIGDIVSQDTDVSAADASDIFGAATVVMVPFDSNANVLSMRVSSVKINNSGKTCVEWSMTQSGSSYKRVPGASADDIIPASIRTPGTWLVVPEVEYQYTPIIGVDVTGVIKMTEKLFLRPRQSVKVTAYNQPPVSLCPDT